MRDFFLFFSAVLVLFTLLSMRFHLHKRTDSITHSFFRYIAPGVYDPEIYESTREFVLSRDNPTFSQSRDGRISGIGSPHMKKTIKNNIWPMSLLAQALTSTSLEEKTRLVETLLDTTGGTGWMHESFDANRPAKYTRKWFCWADALFAEVVLSMSNDECLRKPWPPLPPVTKV